MESPDWARAGFSSDRVVVLDQDELNVEECALLHRLAPRLLSLRRVPARVPAAFRLESVTHLDLSHLRPASCEEHETFESFLRASEREMNVFWRLFDRRNRLDVLLTCEAAFYAGLHPLMDEVSNLQVTRRDLRPPTPVFTEKELRGPREGAERAEGRIVYLCEGEAFEARLDLLCDTKMLRSLRFKGVGRVSLDPYFRAPRDGLSLYFMRLDSLHFKGCAEVTLEAFRETLEAAPLLGKLTVTDAPWFGPDHLEAVARGGHEHLTTLRLGTPALRDRHLECLAELDSLVELDLRTCMSLTWAGVRGLVARMRELWLLRVPDEASVVPEDEPTPAGGRVSVRPRPAKRSARARATEDFDADELLEMLDECEACALPPMAKRPRPTLL